MFENDSFLFHHRYCHLQVSGEEEFVALFEALVVPVITQSCVVWEAVIRRASSWGRRRCRYPNIVQ